MRRVVAIFIMTAGLFALVSWPAHAAPIGAPVTFQPASGTTLTLEGRGAFHGSLEIRRVGGGLTIINELDLDSYVAGIREVPRDWPMEALKAQAVAARTYVLWERQRGYWRRFGYDVCGTTSCQVYQGADAEQGVTGRRWADAVRATSGQVLLADGQPALTRYFSSSGGRTLPNEAVFPNEGPIPYLKGVDDPADAVSPLHTWTVTFTRAQLEQILQTGIGLHGTLADVSADEANRRVTIKTLHGTLEISTARFSSAVSDKAPVLFPKAFPAARNDGKPMPMTIPSARYTIEKTDAGFIVHGRGYGHGVGMSQWGAKGLADRGRDYREILGTYYRGLSPSQWSGAGTIRVSIEGAAGAVRVSGDGTFGVYAGADALASSTLGGWSVAVDGVRSLGVTPPQGHQLPLVLTGVEVPPTQVVDPPKRGGLLRVGFVVPKPAEITAIVTLNGQEVARSRIVVEAGERTIDVPLDPKRLTGRASYRVDVSAFDGIDRVTKTADVVLTRPTSSLLWWAAAFAAIGLAGFGLFRFVRARSAVRREVAVSR